jgi:transposase
VLCELVPGGFAGEITAGLAARLLDQVTPAGAVDVARCDLAAELLADVRRLDAQRRECATKLAATVRASGTSLTGLFGVGPVIAGLVIGDVPDVTRFPGRSHFAAYNDRKITAGKTHKEALRCLKRRISDAIDARLRADARQAAAASKDPGGQPGNDSVSSAAGFHPEHRLFGPATPGPETSLLSTAALTPAIPPSGPPANKTRRAT